MVKAVLNTSRGLQLLVYKWRVTTVLFNQWLHLDYYSDHIFLIIVSA